MKRLLYILLLLLPLNICLAQEDDVVLQDKEDNSINTPELINDTISSYDLPIETLPEPQNLWKPDPLRAVWMGAIIPGYGQIYNRSYWKLPIVYGAFMGCAYAITWTNGLYTDYKTAYRDIVTDPKYDPLDPTKSYVAILPDGYSIEQTTGKASMGGRARYTTTLQNGMNSYRRYRDISIVATVLVYALTLVDAYVDAQLYDFDISPDLSLNIEPILNRDPLNNRSTELKLAFTLK